MKKKNTSRDGNSVPLSLDAIDYEEDGFIDGDINLGNTIATFSFGMNEVTRSNESTVKSQDYSNEPTPQQVPDNKTYNSSIKGLTPPINGEHYTIKRCYQFRPSTIRKLNELKAKHCDINVYLNTVLDEAITYYYNHVFNTN